MKRWQDRGVVDDSEDEELSLELESQSPERPTKRAKHSQEPETTRSEHIVLIPQATNLQDFENGEELDWIQPKVATTYSRKAKAPQKTTSPETAERALEETETTTINDGLSGPPESPSRNVPSTSLDFSREQNISSSISEDLPNLSTVLALHQPSDERRSMTSTSSPLSERDVSPPPGFPFSDRVSGLSAAVEEAANSPVQAPTTAPAEDQLPQSTAMLKRNLRARKAIQINPYQFDRAQYLEQCRARGVRPVRLMEQPEAEKETESQSQTASSQLYSSPRTTQEQTQSPKAEMEGFDYFDVPNSSDLEIGNDHRLPKRRRLIHKTRKDRDTIRASRDSAQRANPRSQLDELSIPPSPPRTSSDLSNVDDAEPLFRATASGFRMPLGLTPVPLPTPQISSETKSNGDDDSTSGLPPRRPLSSVLKRHDDGEGSTITVSSDSDAHSDAESELEARRLRREQKRIRGVLPASWLKIDLKTQQAKRAQGILTTRRLSATSPEKSEALKGVARRINRATQRHHSTGLLEDLPGGLSDSDGSAATPSLSRKQTRLALDAERFSIAPSTTVDDDMMENDFVDPMLAGRSRQRKSKSHRVHQPRINEVFRASSTPQNDFSEERRANRMPDGGRKGIRARNGTGASRPRRKPVAHLSIADVPLSPSDTHQRQPQFVKLALRQTRHAPDRGRHSPTHKIIRLATAEETEEASSMLRAWREGIIAPRRDGDHFVELGSSASALVDLPTAVNGSRALHQQAFPAPIVQSKKPRHTASQPPRQRRTQQSRLKPLELQVDPHSPGPDENETAPTMLAVRQRVQQPVRPRRLREAQLETLQRDFDETHREAMFERRMQCMTESVARPLHRHKGSGFQLDRFLRVDSVLLPHVQSLRKAQTNDPMQDTPARKPVKSAHQPRKSKARRLDIETRRYRQPSEPLPSIDLERSDSFQVNADVDLAQPVLQGLRSFGTRYSFDFDINPLHQDMFFHASTFIGSGEFHDALNLSRRDLTRETGHVRIYFEGEIFEWGAWNEDVAAEIARITTLISKTLHTLDDVDTETELDAQVNAVDRNIDYLLRSVVRYCTKCLWFMDPVDRQSCVERLSGFVASLAEILIDQGTTKASLAANAVRALQYQVVIAKQVSILSQDSAVPSSVKKNAQELLLSSSKSLVKHSVAGKFAGLRSFYDDNCRAAVREAGIREETSAFGSLVILRCVLEDPKSNPGSFWRVASEGINSSVSDVCNIKVFEQLWQNLFTILPTMEMDAAGVTKFGSRFAAQQDDWSLVQAVVDRVLQLYEPSSQVRGYSVNEYVRVVLSRCHCLINKWGWWRSERLLNTIFDFFARRGFNLLNKEESHGSPKFLEDLSSPDVRLEVMPDDCSFHVFLKMLATSILGMRKHTAYSDRKVRSIIWRFVPNHNRVYKKDFDLQKADLEALRNQHDLFSVLYYGSPPNERLGADLVLGLVDHSTSHREACRLSVRSWANIACYQASTSEPEGALEELTGWFSGTIKEIIAQYRLAKTEAEQDFEHAKQEVHHDGEMAVDQEVLESTIASNQRQVAAIIVDALAGLKRAVRSASSLLKVRTLVESTHFMYAFDLFDPSQRRLLGAMQEALLVCEAALDMQAAFGPATRNLPVDNDDSQDFGDSSALEAFAAVVRSPEHAAWTVADALLPSIGQFLSNVFGADAASEDSLLEHLINLWTRLAGVTVLSSAKSWSSYVDDYGTTAWSQLRDTAQKRKFTPYFMSQMLVQSNGHEEVREPAIMAWLLALVEREALLKFQHRLTSALLNHCCDEPLLCNLPFIKERSSGQFDIKLADLRQRRLSLVSSVLSNMRTHYDGASRESSSSGQELRSRYSTMLRQLMQAMKANYQELQGDRDTVADSSVQGAYVDFVQHVVSYLQQYALGICQVDRFFTDSAAFPLPATDPTYVVGRLRSYVPKLAENSGRTQLAMFIQTVSERAAIDNQQQYLVNQMTAAMSDTEEEGSEAAPTLRLVLLTSIFPAYIANALSTSCSWIPALPMLRACEAVISDLLYNFQVEDDQAVLAVVDTTISVLHSICSQCNRVLVHAELLEHPHTLKMLSAMLEVGKACLTIASYIQRATSLGKELSRQVQLLQQQAVAVEARLQDQDNADFLDAPDCGRRPVCAWPDTRAVAEKQVREAVNAKWHAIDGRYLVQRGNTMKEVVVEVGDSRDEKRALLQVIASFCRAFEATFGDPHRTRKESVCDDMLGALVV